ncbi:carboxylate--amine ligase [Enterococcus lactis]|uniref:carboxylate--amine ligase n=1 Tax=Enterococcus lactis TaxID=357441 RepID=UPI0039A67AD9
MHIILNRYSARIFKLNYVCDKNAVVLVPSHQKEKYDTFLKEGNCLPKVIFIDDYTFPSLVLEIRKIDQTENIESITTLSEEDIDWAGYLSDHFVEKNTKSISNLLFKDKYFMRSFLQGVVEQPKFRLLESEDDLKLFWKEINTSEAVLKPRTGAASMGVKKIERGDTIDPTYFTGTFIIEEYVKFENMLTCDGYAISDSIKRFYVHEYDDLLLDTLNEKSFYLIRTSKLYSQSIDMIELALLNCQKVLKEFTVIGELTPFHFEWFYDLAKHRMIFCEVGKRFGGGNIPKMIMDAYDVDILHEYWEILTNKDSLNLFSYGEKIVMPKKISGTFALYKKTGYIKSVPAKDSLYWADRVFINLSPGEYVNSAKNIIENSMMVQFTGENDEDFNEKLNEIKRVSQQFIYSEK